MAKKSTTLGMAAGQDDWQVEDDLRTLMRCEEIEADPKRLAACQKLAKKKLMDLASIAKEGKDD